MTFTADNPVWGRLGRGLADARDDAGRYGVSRLGLGQQDQTTTDDTAPDADNPALPTGAVACEQLVRRSLGEGGGEQPRHADAQSPGAMLPLAEACDGPASCTPNEDASLADLMTENGALPASVLSRRSEAKPEASGFSTELPHDWPAAGALPILPPLILPADTEEPGAVACERLVRRSLGEGGSEQPRQSDAQLLDAVIPLADSASRERSERIGSEGDESLVAGCHASACPSIMNEMVAAPAAGPCKRGSYKLPARLICRLKAFAGATHAYQYAIVAAALTDYLDSHCPALAPDALETFRQLREQFLHQGCDGDDPHR